METLPERLKRLRQQMGLTQRRLAAALNMSHGTIANYEVGNRTPNWEDLRKMADFLGVSVAYLLGETDDPTPLDALERQKIPLNKRVPLIGRVAAGTPLFAEENIEGWIVLPEGVEADFALRVKGDSMEPVLREGQIVFCVHADQREPQPRNMVVAMIDGEATVKWLLRSGDGTWFLRAANPQYPDIILNRLSRVIAIVVDYLGGQPVYRETAASEEPNA